MCNNISTPRVFLHLCLFMSSVLQQIPLFTSESQDSTYIPQDAVVSTGLQILQVGQQTLILGFL